MAGIKPAMTNEKFSVIDNALAAAAAQGFYDGVSCPLAGFPGSADRPPQGFMCGFAGKPDPIVDRFHQDLAGRLPTRCTGRKGASHIRLRVPTRGVAAHDG